ncbi:MAG: peroxiredoxin [Candidatus Komeilibacteria bacterium RIFCSPLOWO2_01_FULL_53_11]|uniref:Peroxiredoxin n=1 Tax=Candidatus Komeilibacteria bacterium RIFCSPLOWO2_01_FULL_53_11 TaxID=1798552 RepID=A0A1G2BX98_9BACT|nr:MAG: peroxiredoxin [Candidatus Komeilibacteria bacterium RIFCSPLOWO2_01_FULL_53_11]
MTSEQQLAINHPAPGFTAKAYDPASDQFVTKSLADYRGKWVVLFFYPADFTFVCPTELEDMAAHYTELQKLNVEVMSISTDSAYAHKAWHDSSDAIRTIKFPMISDATGEISRNYTVYVADTGEALRGTFIINPEGLLKSFEINDNALGRSSEELMRKIQASQFVEQHGDQVCPANWHPGKKTLKPGIDLVNKI